MVESQLGVRLNRAFATFDEIPLGSASLAQVHRATLRDGRAVAVKVQRPGIADSVREDLDAITRLAGHADRMTDLGRRIRFVDWVHEFGKALMAELDYRAEAENLERFGRHLKGYRELYVPAPVWDYSAQRVLTMELVTGTKVTELTGLRRTEQKLDSLASALMRGTWTRCSCTARSTPIRIRATFWSPRTAGLPCSTWAWSRTCPRSNASAC
jgi:predicted unusual protein kinase regulating ubiquinone biosynthesis (AarF/ABC1/UbiB family)